MNNRHLSRTRKYNNNDFIISSGAYFQQVLIDNSKSIKRKEVSKAADKGAPSERRASIVSTPPHPQDDFQDNTCIYTQQSCVYDEHVSPSAASPVLPLTWHCYMWLHVMCDV